MSEEKNDYAFYSEALHSSYLFYTMEVDKLNKQLQAAKEENERQHELRLKSERNWDKREKQWIAEAEKAWKSQSSEYAQELEHTIRLRDEQILSLTQQNKQMREMLESAIYTLGTRVMDEKAVTALTSRLQQTLKGVE